MAKRNFKPTATTNNVKSTAKQKIKPKRAVNAKRPANTKRPAMSKRPAKLKCPANTKRLVKSKQSATKTQSPQSPATGRKPSAQNTQLPADYFDHLPLTHNMFIGHTKADTLENVIAGIDIICELATQDPQGLLLNEGSCFGLLWFTQNLRNALQFELQCRG